MTSEAYVDALNAAVAAASSIIPNSDGVLWEFTHESGEGEPVTLEYALDVALRAALPHLGIHE